jgi:hypothetical protein
MLDRLRALFRGREAHRRADSRPVPEAARSVNMPAVTGHATDVSTADVMQRSEGEDKGFELSHEPAADPAISAEIDAFLATITITDDLRDAVPSDFDGRAYLLRNPDVLRARMSPWTHYVRFGRGEGRGW